MVSHGTISVVSHPDRPKLTSSKGKQWHETKKAFRPTAGLSSYEKRQKERTARLQMKAKEKELKDEKEAERQVRIVRQSLGAHGTDFRP